MRDLPLNEGWGIIHDVHDRGEQIGLHRPDFAAPMGAGASPWRPIARLEHLQPLLAAQPWFGSALHAYNEHAWWYRIVFRVPAGFGAGLRLRFAGVDYRATVWLNGGELGRHEGYADPFVFAVDDAIRRDGDNTLVVRVESPWDREVAPEDGGNRVGGIVRRLIKGTYEHADTFVQRDVNPIGIHAPVWLEGSDDAFAEAPRIAVAAGAPGGAARVTVAWDVDAVRAMPDAVVALTILDDEAMLPVVSSECRAVITPGGATITLAAEIPAAKRWRTWDRGTPSLYRARLTLRADGRDVVVAERAFGVRTVELVRDAARTELRVDGEPVFLRGTTYFPDVYVSLVDRGRWRRDLDAMVAHGCNAVRVHVHQQPDGFYDECDRLGLLVLQDSDLNWRFPAAEAAFGDVAETLFRRMIRRLQAHPSIFAWVCMNEVPSSAPYRALGLRLAAAARGEDPTRPTILNSWQDDDSASGDCHFYDGSLAGGVYTDLAARTCKLLSEFGVDAPPAPAAMRAVPAVADRLAPLAPRIAELHDYQYRLLKFQMERLRMTKGAPSAGYFQFLWIDLCPQSFYGVVDHFGRPKCEGLGGGLRAFAEANMPVCVALQHLDRPETVWLINDLPRALGRCRVAWTVAVDGGGVVAQGDAEVDVPADARVRVADVGFAVDPARRYRIVLVARDALGTVVARNRYEDPFHHPGRPAGYPERMDHELGMRLWGLA
ncbi:MAG TPA: glycoside hydrolase family 2 TIM barrel-domain containing protein [Planctomycetota bacterium]|nr:glycoside hydrolase family 2 TIM barrel-domain containing protein [Planctomycetota bacterium]